MKFKFFILVAVFLVMCTVNISAQEVDIDKLPEYVVVASTNGGVFSDVDIDIRIKKSKYAEELKRLEKRLNDDDFVETYTDLLNEMHDLGFDFIDAFENKVKDGGLKNVLGGDLKIRQNLVFRKRK